MKLHFSKRRFEWLRLSVETATLLAIAVYTCIAYKQWVAMRIATDAARTSADAAMAAVEVARNNFQVQKDSVEKTLVEMSKQTRSMEAAAKAASDANRLNRDNFLATERPWVKADIGVGGPLFYDVNGVNMTLRFQLTNVGHSPATHVWIHPQFLAPAVGAENFDPRAAQRKIYDQIKTAPLDPSGYTLFPGDTISQDIRVFIPPNELKRITRKTNILLPFIIGTIDYSFVFEDGHHQTGFIVEVHRSDTPRPESIAKNRNPSAIFTDEGDIPATELRLFRSFLGQEYAD